MEVIVVFGFIGLCACLAVVAGICVEKRDWNGGYCRFCKEKFSFFSYDSQGGRGYECEKCGHKVWISYNCIDKRGK